MVATMRLCLLLVASAARAEPLSDALSAQWEAVQALEVAALVRPALKDALRWQRDTLDAFQHAYPDVQVPPHPAKVAYSESLVAGLPAEKRDSLLYTHLEKAKVSEELALARLKHHQGATLSSMAAENVTMLQTEALHELRDIERMMEKADSEQEQALAAHLGKLGDALNAVPAESVPPRSASGESVAPKAVLPATEAPCNASSVASPPMEEHDAVLCTPAMKKLLGNAFPCDAETLAKNASRVSQQAAEGDAALAAIEARALEAVRKAAELRRAANETAHAKEEKQSEVEALEKAKAAAEEKAKKAADRETALSAEAYRAMSAAAQARKAGEAAEHVAEHARLERQQKHMEDHERMGIENGENPAEAARHLAREETIKAQAETVRALVRAMVSGTVGLEEPLRNARAAMQRMMEAARAEDDADRRAPSTGLRASKEDTLHADSPADLSLSKATPAATPAQAVDELVKAAEKAAGEEIEALSKRATPAKLPRSATAASLNLLAQPGGNAEQDKEHEAYLRGDGLAEARKAAESALRMARADAAGCSSRGEHGCAAKADAMKAATAVVREIEELVTSTEHAEAQAAAKQASLLKNIQSVTEGGKAKPSKANEDKRQSKKAMKQKQKQKQLESTLHEALAQKAAAQDRADRTEMRATLAEEALRHATAEHARRGTNLVRAGLDVSTARTAMVNATAAIMTEHARRVAAQEKVMVLKRQVNEAEAAKTTLKNKGMSSDMQDKTVADLRAQLDQAIKREHDTSARVSEVQKQMGLHKQHLIEVAHLAQEQEKRRKDALVEAEQKIAEQSKALKLAQQEAEEAHEELAAAVAEKENVLVGLAEKDASTSFAEAEQGRLSALLLQKEQELQQKEPTKLESVLNDQLRHNSVLRQHIKLSREQAATQLAEVLAAAQREKEAAVQDVLKQKQLELEKAIMDERRKARKQQTQHQLQAVQTARSHKESVERLRKQLDATSAELEHTREVSIDSIANETKLRMLAMDKVANLEKQVHQAITGNMKSGKEFSQNLAIHKVARLEAEQERSTLATQLKQIEMEARNNMTAFKLAELQWQIDHNKSLELIRQEAHNQTAAAAAASQREAEAKLSAHKLKTEQEQARLSTWKIQAERAKIEEAAARRVAEHIANERAAAAKAEKALKEAEEERFAASEAMKTKDDAVQKAADLEIEAAQLRRKLEIAGKEKAEEIKQVKLADYKEHLSVLAATDKHLEQLEQEQEEQRARATKLEEERNQRVNYLYNETKELRRKLARKDKLIAEKTRAIKRKEEELANRTKARVSAQEQVIELGGKLSEAEAKVYQQEEKLHEQQQRSLEKLRSQRRQAHNQYAALEEQLKKKTSEHSIALVAARNETDAQVNEAQQMLNNAEQLLIEARRNATEQLAGAEARHAAALAASQQRYEQAVKDSETASNYMEGEVQKMAEEHKLKEAELHKLRQKLETEKADTVERIKGEAIEYVQKIKGDANSELQRIRDEAQGLVTKVRGDAGAKVLESEQKLAEEARRRSAAQEKAAVLESQINEAGREFEAMSSEMSANLTRIQHTREELEAKLTKQQLNAAEKLKAQRLLAQEQLAQQTKAADRELNSVRKATDDVLHEAEVRLEEAKRMTAEQLERRLAAQEKATVLASNLSATEGALAQATSTLAAAEDRHRVAQKQSVEALRSHRLTSQAELQMQRATLQKELDSARNASRVLLETQKRNMQKEIDVVRNGSQIRLENLKAAAQRELEAYMKNSRKQLESQKAAMEARLEQAKKITDEQEERLHEALGITEEQLVARRAAQEKATVLATNLSAAEKALASAEERHRAKEEASLQALRNHRTVSQMELAANRREMEASHNEMVQRLMQQQQQLQEAMKQQQLASEHAMQEQQRAAEEAFKQERMEHQSTRLAADQRHADELQQTVANLTSQLASAEARAATSEARITVQHEMNVETLRTQRAVAQKELTEALAKMKREHEANLTAFHTLAAVDMRHLEEELNHEEAEKVLALKKADDLDAHRRSAQEKVQELSASLTATAAALEHTEKQMNEQQQQGLEKLKQQGKQWEERTAKLQLRLTQTMQEKEADVKKAEAALAAADSHIRQFAQNALAEKQALAAQAVEALAEERRRAGEEKAKLEAARHETEKRAERLSLHSALLAANLTTAEAELQGTIATYTAQLHEAEKKLSNTEARMSSQQKANIEALRATRAVAQKDLEETHSKRIAAQERAETLEASLKQAELQRLSAQERAAVLATNLTVAKDEMDRANERLLQQRMQAKEMMMIQRREADEKLAVAQERLERERSEATAQERMRSEQLMETANQLNAHVQQMHVQHEEELAAIKAQHNESLAEMQVRSVALEAALNAVTTRHKKQLEQSQLERAAASLAAQNEASEHQRALDMATSTAASLESKLKATQQQMEAQKASMLAKLKEQRAAAEERTHGLEEQLRSQGAEADIRLVETKRTAEEQLASMDELLKKTTANADAVMARELQRLRDEHAAEMAEVQRKHEANVTSLTALGAVELRQAEEAAAENLAAFEAEATSKVEEVGRLLKQKEESMQADASAKQLALEQQAAERVAAQVKVAVEAEAKQHEAEQALRNGLAKAEAEHQAEVDAMQKSLNDKDQRMSEVQKAHIQNIRSVRLASQEDLQRAKNEADAQLAQALHKVELAKAEADALTAEAAANKARVQERAAVLAANLTTTELQLAAAEAELVRKDEVLKERETTLLEQIEQKEQQLHSLHASSAAEHQKLMAEKAVQLNQMRQSTADEHTRRLRELEAEHDQKVSALVQERQTLLQERDQKLAELNADRQVAKDEAVELEKKLASMQKMSIEKLRAQRQMAHDEAARLEKQLRSQAQEQVTKVREEAEARAGEAIDLAQHHAQELAAEFDERRAAAQEKALALKNDLDAKQAQMEAQDRLLTMKLQDVRTQADLALRQADSRRTAAQERVTTLESEAGELKINSMMLETALNSTLTRLHSANVEHEKEMRKLKLSKRNELQTAARRLKQTTDEYEQAQLHQQQLLKASEQARKREHKELLRAQTFSQTQSEQIAALMQEGLAMNVSMNELMDREEEVRSLQRKTMNDLAETDQLRQSAEARLHELEQQHNAARDQVKALQSNLISTTENATAVEKARVAAQERAVALDERRKAAQERATVLEQNVTELEEHGRSLAAQMQEQREKLLNTIKLQRTNSEKELKETIDRAAAMAAEKVAESELELKAAQLQAESALSGAKKEAEEQMAALKRDHENTLLHVREEDAAQLEKAEAEAREQSAMAHQKLLELEEAHRVASTRVVALEAEAKETSAKMAAYEATVAAAAEHLKRKTAELEEAQRVKLAESDSALSETKKQLDMHKLNLEQLRTDARAQLSEAWQKREAAQERADNLEKSLSQSKNELEKLHGQKQAAQEKAAALDEMAEQMKRAMDESEEQFNTRMASMTSLHTEKLRQQRLESEKREGALQNQVDDEANRRMAAQEKVSALVATADEMAEAMTRMEGTRAGAQERVSELQAESIILKDHAKELEAAVMKANDDLKVNAAVYEQAVASAKKAAKEQKAEMEARVQSVLDEKQALTKQRESAVAQAAATQNQLDGMKKKLRDAEREQREQTAKFSAQLDKTDVLLSRAQEKARKEAQRYQAELAETDQRRATAQGKVAVLMSEAQSMNASVSQMVSSFDTEFKRLATNLDASEQHAEKLKSAVTTTTAGLLTAEQKRENAQARAEDAQARAGDAQARAGEAQSHAAKLRAALDKAKAESVETSSERRSSREASEALWAAKEALNEKRKAVVDSRNARKSSLYASEESNEWAAQKQLQQQGSGLGADPSAQSEPQSQAQSQPQTSPQPEPQSAPQTAPLPEPLPEAALTEEQQRAAATEAALTAELEAERGRRHAAQEELSLVTKDHQTLRAHPSTLVASRTDYGAAPEAKDLVAALSAEKQRRMGAQEELHVQRNEIASVVPMFEDALLKMNASELEAKRLSAEVQTLRREAAEAKSALAKGAQGHALALKALSAGHTVNSQQAGELSLPAPADQQQQQRRRQQQQQRNQQEEEAMAIQRLQQHAAMVESETRPAQVEAAAAAMRAAMAAFGEAIGAGGRADLTEPMRRQHAALLALAAAFPRADSEGVLAEAREAEAQLKSASVAASLAEQGTHLSMDAAAQGLQKAEEAKAHAAQALQLLSTMGEARGQHDSARVGGVVGMQQSVLREVQDAEGASEESLAREMRELEARQAELLSETAEQTQPTPR